MAQWVSFKTIKERVSIEQILEHYGLLPQATRKGHELRIRCPFHDDAQPSCTANIQKNGFHCFGCGAHGNVLAFVRLKESMDSGDVNKDDRKAALLIAEWFGIPSERHATQCHTPDPDTTRAPATDQTHPQGIPAHTVTQAPEERVNLPLKFAFKHLDERHPSGVEAVLGAADEHTTQGVTNNGATHNGDLPVLGHTEHGQWLFCQFLSLSVWNPCTLLDTQSARDLSRTRL